MKIKCEDFLIPTAPIEGVNPLPAFRSRKHKNLDVSDDFPVELREAGGFMKKVLPYLVQDRYTHTRREMPIKSFVLENEYLKARFLPSFGGRLHSLFDKQLEKDLLFTNTVIQPCNLATRNAWLSGGIEWNIGNFGHTYTTCDDVFAAVLDDGEGNNFLRIYEFERNKSIFWQIDFHLPDGSRELISHVRMVNPFDKATTTYWWTNIAVPTDKETRVLASNERVISFVGGKCCFERLPKIEAMPGVDVTYPNNATRSFDYFIQKDKDGESTWEAAAYEDGKVFFERSSAPLYYKKLFAWGNHNGGRHWQEFLSAGPGTGYYAELQAGIAPSQLHDKLFPARSKFEWTQCFGSLSLDKAKLFDEDYIAAKNYCGRAIDSRISSSDIDRMNEKYTRLADIAVAEESIMHRASAFGALEAMRMKLDGDGEVPSSLLFPEDTVTPSVSMWKSLLESGTLPHESTDSIPTSYMTSEKWLPRLRLAKETGDWNAYLHYGVAIYEYQRTDDFINRVYEESEDRRAIDEARSAWQSSCAVEPNVWAYRNLAFLEYAQGNVSLAEEYYDKAIALPSAFVDYALVSEYLIFLMKNGKYQKLWDIYSELPDSLKRVDRIKITVSVAAVKLGRTDYVERFFDEEHYDIFEGETTLTDVWFEYCARKMANEQGIDISDPAELDRLIDLAWDSCPPDYSIDFRTSASKKNKYRI